MLTAGNHRTTSPPHPDHAHILPSCSVTPAVEVGGTKACSARGMACSVTFSTPDRVMRGPLQLAICANSSSAAVRGGE